MGSWLEERQAERLWAGSVGGILLVLIGGILAFPEQVYDEFVWRYFLGPVDADAHGASCAVRSGDAGPFAGTVERLPTQTDCQTAVGIVAEPGYTTISTISYAVILLLALIGVLFLFRRLELGADRGLFFALFPFMLFGGALRTVEDANVVFLREGSMVIPYPWSGLIISPFIYFTVFFIALGAFLGSLWLARTGAVDRYEYPLASIGAVSLLVTLGWLGWLAGTTTLLEFHWLVPALTLGGATGITAVVWVATERYAPRINEGTGYMGALVVWGHTVDGIANVFSLDWGHLIGLPSYAPKHVVNAAIVDITAAVQPAWLTDSIGSAWPFLFVKVAVAVVVVWIFDDTIFDESPRFAILLLIAILAVGIGPGTRDFLRATFGI